VVLRCPLNQYALATSTCHLFFRAIRHRSTTRARLCLGTFNNQVCIQLDFGSREEEEVFVWTTIRKLSCQYQNEESDTVVVEARQHQARIDITARDVERGSLGFVGPLLSVVSMHNLHNSSIISPTRTPCTCSRITIASTPEPQVAASFFLTQRPARLSTTQFRGTPQCITVIIGRPVRSRSFLRTQIAPRCG
jgi:hypothetical protein